MMDPHGGHKPKRGMGRGGGMSQKHGPMHYPPSNASMIQLHGTSGPSSLHSIASSHGGTGSVIMAAGPPHPGSAWQTSLSDVHSAVASHHPHPAHAHVMPAGSVGPGVAAGVGGAGMIIPRAKVKRSGGGGYTNEGYNSDDGGVSDEANRAMSEHMSMSSRHRRKSVPSFTSGVMGVTSGSHGGTTASRRSRSQHDERGGSIDPLLDGFSDTDGAGSGPGNRQSNGTLHLSVSRAELDRADTIGGRSFVQRDHHPSCDATPTHAGGNL